MLNVRSSSSSSVIAELADLQAQIDALDPEFNFATTPETIAGTSTVLAVTPAGRKAANTDIDPRTYGFSTAASGTVNSAALQAAIDEACGPGDPVTTVRTANRRVVLPAGIYLLAAPITVRSVIGVQIIGQGMCELRADSNMAAVFDINGAAYSLFEGFTITGSAGVQVDNAFYTYWDSAGSSRSNTANSYRNITVRNLDFVTAFRVGKPGVGGADVSDDVFDHIILNGAWEDGEAARYQEGLVLGNGTGGNNLTHNVYHLRIQSIRYGLVNSASQAAVFGAGFAGGEAAIKVGLTGHNTFNGMRVESYQRLLITNTGSSAPPMITMRDVLYSANDLHTDTYWVRFDLGGTFSMSEVKCVNPPSGVVPKIAVQPGGGGSSRLFIEGLAIVSADAPYDVSTLFTVTGNGSLRLTGFVTMDDAGHALGIESLELPAAAPASADLSGIAPSLFGKTNEYWGMPLTRTTAVTTAGTLYTFGVYVPIDCTVNRIGAEVTTLAAASTISLGIYNDDGAGSASTLLLDAGTIDGGSATAQELTISQALVGGEVYHFAALVQGGTPTMRVISGSWAGVNSSLANAVAGTNLRAGRNRGSVVGTSLPSPAATSSVASNIPSVAVRFA